MVKIDKEYNGIGLMYASDYGYATNGGSIGRKACFDKELRNWDNIDGNYQSECGAKDWLKPINGFVWTITSEVSSKRAFTVSSNGYSVSVIVVNNLRRIWPTLYLKSSVKIIGNSNANYGSIENPFVLQ